ncbi:MAG: maltotransferase domain-containing protein [Chloroflexota bacterium]
MTGPAERRRVVIRGVRPEIDGGRFAIKRIAGEGVHVEADVFTDGHDRLRCVLRHRPDSSPEWTEVEMRSLGNDRWVGGFAAGAPGRHRYGIVAWIDPFGAWAERLAARLAAGQDPASELLVGQRMVSDAAGRASGADAATLRECARKIADPVRGPGLAASEDLARLMREYDDRTGASIYEKELPLVVDRERARFSAWYEMFPRSAGQPERHGTLADVVTRLPLIAHMGFDVLYLPPIHPIGDAHRRGPNNTGTPSASDVGSPWAIGASTGGHDAVHPRLGTIDDLRELVAAAARAGIDVALDLAFQCSPDHPYVREHPEWFRHRPDGTIQNAENPPKRYLDIYPFDFDTEDRRGLWGELLRVVRFWIAQGIRVFRVDNPHTKPFAFWEWLIGEVKTREPDVIFLSEAFTRPKVMYHLAKLGFTQSYTYFAWRNTKAEIVAYFTELAQTDVREHFRANLWPNTPDILTEQLQHGGRAAFIARLTLAATLGASYGIYGPAFELGESRAVRHGSEEYLDSEKYQIRVWDWDERAGIRDIVTRLNRIRHEHPALQGDRSLRFHHTDSDMIVAYSKRDAERGDTVLVVVNLDPHHTQAGFVDLALADLGLGTGDSYQVHDLLSGGRYLWRGSRNYVELDPRTLPAHVFAVRRKVRTERDFDYYE